LILEKTNKEDGLVLLNLRKCGRCNSIIELFQAPVQGDSYDSLVYEILQDKEKTLKAKFESFTISCPQCREAQEGVTYMKLDEDDIKLMNGTPLSKIWITVK
jgi:hypothetical protein